MKKSIVIAVIAAIAIIGGVSYYSKNEEAFNNGDSSGQKETIRYISMDSHEDVKFVMDYAEKNGIFEKNDLGLEKVSVERNIADVMLAEGGVAIGTTSDYLIKYSNGADFRLLANTFYPYNTFKLSRFPIDQLQNVKKAAIGRTAGFGGVGGATSLYFKRKGFDISGMEFVSIPADIAKEDNLSKGEVDLVGITSEKFMHQIDAYNKYHVLEPHETYAGTFFWKGIITTQKTLDQKPEGLKRFVKAVNDTIESLKKDREGAVALLMEKNQMDQPRADKFYERFLLSAKEVYFAPDDVFIDGLVENMKEAEEDIDTEKLSTDAFIYSDFAKEVSNSNEK